MTAELVFPGRDEWLAGVTIAVNVLHKHQHLAPSDVGYSVSWPFFVFTVEDALVWVRVMDEPPRAGLMDEHDRLRLDGQIRGLKVQIIVRQQHLGSPIEGPHPSDSTRMRTQWRIPKRLADAIDLTYGNVLAADDLPEGAS
ncbi:hypothetical protein ACIBEJ_34635 [Nonomuraea sp. NPDC050790]|uniref:hypothetical protein n=1 Tax=Nonomuraea sp. NPDC050790 TaxID=3364371 RepID=UPI0037A278D2